MMRLRCSILLTADLFGGLRSGRVVLFCTEPVEVAAFVNSVPVFIRKSVSRQVNRFVADWAKVWRTVIGHDGWPLP